jgi:hypothetical protein
MFFANEMIAQNVRVQCIFYYIKLYKESSFLWKQNIFAFCFFALKSLPLFLCQHLTQNCWTDS